MFKASQVVAELNSRLAHRINMHVHIQAWRYFEVRPATGSAHPERTLQQYCLYDTAHSDYLYTRAWIEKLVRELKGAQDFERIVGKAPDSDNGAT
jgi:hypothetical protein